MSLRSKNVEKCLQKEYWGILRSLTGKYIIRKENYPPQSQENPEIKASYYMKALN